MKNSLIKKTIYSNPIRIAILYLKHNLLIKRYHFYLLEFFFIKLQFISKKYLINLIKIF